MVNQPQLTQGQQQMTHHGLNGGWQSPKDLSSRRNMIAKIIQMIQHRSQNEDAEWSRKVPFMAKKLEESIYRSAPSFEAYIDDNTLKSRLQKVAIYFCVKTKHEREQMQAQKQQQRRLHQQQPEPTVHQHHSPQQTKMCLPREQMDGNSMFNTKSHSENVKALLIEWFEHEEEPSINQFLTEKGEMDKKASVAFLVKKHGLHRLRKKRGNPEARKEAMRVINTISFKKKSVTPADVE
mmetsp:Transcript_24006/g.48585  ORF Transcript_24006/g.48585 Transcript_24006/m.48585 type:complete len:237 (-) Transcript_24006:618-1328(-)